MHGGYRGQADKGGGRGGGREREREKERKRERQRERERERERDQFLNLVIPKWRMLCDRSCGFVSLTPQ